MTRDQHLEFCKRCKNREFNPQQGIICAITKKIAAFEGTCENFNLDESVKIDAVPSEPVPAYKAVGDLSIDVKNKLRTQQDIVYAIIGGLAAAIVGGLIWALITVSTKYQIGYMAIGVGLLVGFSVRYFGAGIDYIFGIVGAFFALMGCAIGNLLSQVAFIADAESIGYFDVLTMLNIPLIGSIFQESFSGMDIVFYGIAAYEGYKFAFRNLSDDLMKNVPLGKLDPPQNANLRLPIVLILFVGLSVGFYFIHKSSVGTKVFNFESGSKMSEGAMDYGVKNGAWSYWYENGNLQQMGYFEDGKQDSVWQFFDEDGKLYRKGKFYKNIQHGVWEDYFPNGQISGTGSWVMGRQHGPWVFYFEDGTMSQKGNYKRDHSDGQWELFYPNGKLSSKGSFNKGDLTGVWTYYYENGDKSQELNYIGVGNFQIVNSWDSKGKQQVKDGNGNYIDYYVDGQLFQTGKVTNSERTGVWKIFTSKGTLREEGEYKSGLYYLNNSWSLDGKPQVVKGEGTYENYYDDDKGSVQETGTIKGGLRTGEWNILYSTNGNVLQKINFVQGKQTGKQESFFEGGEKNVEGNLKDAKRDGEWKWYFQNGTLETSVMYIDGLKQGDQDFYDDEGNLVHTEVYSNAEIIEVKAGGKEEY